MDCLHPMRLRRMSLLLSKRVRTLRRHAAELTRPLAFRQTKVNTGCHIALSLKLVPITCPATLDYSGEEILVGNLSVSSISVNCD